MTGGALLAALAIARPAHAQTQEEQTETVPPHFGGQRSIGFGPVLGLSTGAGGMVELGLPPVALWLSGGYQPIMVFGNMQGSRAMTFDFFNSAQFNADVSFMPWHSGPRLDYGLLGGYRYDTVLGHGGGAGGVLTMDLGREVGLFASLELLAFPDAASAIRAQGYPGDRDPALPWLQGGANIGLLTYP
jgi:hypothetical protein